jgi:hypothetical protein
MFKKLYQSAAPAERAQIFSLTDFSLALVLRMLELTLFLALFTWLAPLLDTWLQGPLGGAWALFGAAFGSLAFWALCRLPFLIARSQLRGAFGIDPRPFGRRLKGLLAPSLWATAPAAAASALFLLLLSSVSIIYWAAAFLAAVLLAFCALGAGGLFSFALFPGRWRRASAEELPEGVGEMLARLPEGMNASRDSVWVDTAFAEGLRAPYVLAGRVIIPEKALSAFPPPALRSLIVAALLARLVNIPRNTLVYRSLSMALSAPVALILINTLGLGAGYPLTFSPGLMALFWLGCWAAWWFSEFSRLLLSRALTLKLSAAAVAVTRDVPALFDAINILARYNMEPWKKSFFQDLFRPRPSPEQQLGGLKSSLMELTDEAVRQKKRRGPANGSGKMRGKPLGRGADAAGAGAEGGGEAFKGHS